MSKKVSDLERQTRERGRVLLVYLLMARVAHDETDLVRPGKRHSGLDIGSRRDVDRVAHRVPKPARRRLWREGVTTLVGKEGLHDRRGRLEAVGMGSVSHANIGH